MNHIDYNDKLNDLKEEIYTEILSWGAKDIKQDMINDLGTDSEEDVYEALPILEIRYSITGDTSDAYLEKVDENGRLSLKKVDDGEIEKDITIYDLSMENLIIVLSAVEVIEK